MTDEEIVEIEEETECEEIEFELTEGEIDNWISELTRLKEEKGSVELDIDDETYLKINYLEGESE